MLFAIGTMKPSVDMVGRLPEKHRHYNDPCEILYRNLFYCSQSKPTNTHGTYCTFFDATPTSLCTVYCIVACPYDLGNGNYPMWASTPARHDCFTDASHTQADGAFILQRKRLLYALCIYFAARPSNLRSEASRSRSNMEPRTRSRSNHSSSKRSRSNRNRSKRSRSNHNRNKRSRSNHNRNNHNRSKKRPPSLGWFSLARLCEPQGLLSSIGHLIRVIRVRQLESLGPRSPRCINPPAHNPLVTFVVMG